MAKNLLKLKVVLPLLMGSIIGYTLFTLGDADDSPGLSFIGLAAAFLLFMRGIYHTGLIRKGCHIPIILSVFGSVALIFPVILYLDGEIQGLSVVTFIGGITGIVCLSSAALLLKKHR